MSAGLSARRLSEPLKEVDRRMWEWADWSNDFGESVGWPATSVAWRLARIHETGQSFSSRPPNVEIPDSVAETEAAVLRLPKELQDVVFVQYFSTNPIEAKARKARLSRGTYSTRLDRARWSMKMELGV